MIKHSSGRMKTMTRLPSTWNVSNMMRAMSITRMIQCLILYPMRTKKQFNLKFSKFLSILMKISCQLQLYNLLKRLSFTRCVCKRILLRMSSPSNSRSSVLSLLINQHSQGKKAVQDYQSSLSTLSKHLKCPNAVL